MLYTTSERNGALVKVLKALGTGILGAFVLLANGFDFGLAPVLFKPHLDRLTV